MRSAEIPAWTGTEVRDAEGLLIGRVAALRFDPWTSAPSEIVVARPDGTPATLSAAGLRVRLDHVRLAAQMQTV